MFFQEDLAASAETFGDTVTWRNVVEAYSATIDTLAWVVLLLLFELETAVIDDDSYYYCVGARTGLALSPVDAQFSDDQYDQGRTGLHHVCFRAEKTM